MGTIMDKQPTTLDISESFYSVQCEGNTTGYPAYFIRLKACNLMCGGANGSLVKEGKATWWCDTEAVWKRGLEKPFYKLIQQWEHEEIDKWIYEGRIHLIWTGGEPTIPKHQRSIPAFSKHLEQYVKDEHDIELKTFDEIETNGTIVIQDELFGMLDQINCSVKLANSGMEAQRRINPAAIEKMMSHKNYWFKFVISTEECLEEIERDFVNKFNIPHDRVMMMPGLDSQKDFHERTKFSLDMAKKYGYIGLTRLHVSAWDKLTGV
jgi:7-carboxy-7-deazaguanine synthase